MIQRSLTSALLRRFILAFVIVVVGIFAARMFSEHERAHEHALSDLNKLADTFAPAAAGAVWDYQNELLLAITRGIGNHPTVESVTITSAKGKTLAHWQANTTIDPDGALHVSRDLQRRSSKDLAKSIGTLKITSSAARVTSQLQGDLLRGALWVIGLLLFILCLLWVLIRRLVVQPLSLFSHAVESLPGRDYLQKIELPAVQVKEIASLQNSFVRLMAQVAQSHEQISLNNAELGQRVAERTAELSEQARHTRTVLDHIMDAVITINEQGLIQSFNPAAESIFGYSATEAIGRNVKMLMPAHYQNTYDDTLHDNSHNHLSQTLATDREVEGLRKDGSTFALELKISEIERHEHSIYVAMARDITERKRIERMKSEFVSTVSHELRTPLTSISGALGLLSGGVAGELPEQAQKMLEIARRNSLQLEALINDLLDMDKLVAGKMPFDIRPYELSPIIHQAIETTGLYDVDRGIKIRCIGDFPAVQVMIDQQRLLQALCNFLSNAVKFSPDKGTVEVSLTLSDTQVRISVRDYGEGVPEAFRANIFQKFAQADSTDTRQKGGTGLGLAITQEIAERMQGSVGFESVPGQGATFWLLLPLLKEPSSDL